MRVMSGRRAACGPMRGRAEQALGRRIDWLAHRRRRRAVVALAPALDGLTDVRLIADVGIAYLNRGHLAHAERWLRRWVALEYSSAGLSLLAAAQMQRGRLHEAESTLRAALAIRDSDRTRLTLGVVLLEQGRGDEAVAMHRAALAEQPHIRERIENLADMLHDLGRRDEAHRLYTEADALPTAAERRKRRRAARNAAT